MKTLFYSSILFILGSANVLVGQYNYDLYKFPEVKVKGLNLNFNSLGNYNKYELTRDYKSRNFSYDLESNYFQFANTDKRQKRTLFLLRISSVMRNMICYSPRIK
ncbi:MAG: hypothetical protein IPJ13_09770 [Saprospiraceae bacterium]|nr:hypothetical protein [Saprospiraceae bacterium]